MILDNHPDHVFPDVKFLGFWHNNSNPHLPIPKLFVDESWDPAERALVVAHLEEAPIVESYRGSSWCRICGKDPLGKAEHSDGAYQWPEGFAHYVAEHSVKPPAVFIAHVLEQARR